MVKIHVIPEADGYAHVPNVNCGCSPYFGVDQRQVNQSLLIHQAQDEREPWQDIWANTDSVKGKSWQIVSKLG